MVELIPKEEERSWLQNIFFFVSLGVLAISIVTFFVFKNRAAKTEEAVAVLNQRLVVGPSEEERVLEQEVLAFKKRIEDFAVLASQRKDALPALPFLELSAHPNVVFTSFRLDVSKNTLGLTGATDSFRHLAEQVAIFQDSANIDTLELSKVALQGGQVTFALDIAFKEQFFK